MFEMPNITVTLKDGTVHEFKHEGRPGGSWTKTLELKNGFAVIEDEWGRKTIFPSEDIKKIETSPERGYW